jgi:peptide/nickel transport system substrate-binding protein
MKTLLKWTAGAVIALSAITGASAANTLKWGAARDLDSLDPYSYGSTFNLAFLNHVYEALIRYDDKFNITPALAESWETPSPTVLRFHLRKGVKFHNGAPFSADDVVASMTRVSDEASPLKGNLPAFKAVRKVDDYTVDIEMTHPYPLMLNDLTNIFIFNRQWLVDNNSLKPTDAAKKIEGYATHNANGTGPFKVESYRPDTRTVLVVNPAWWTASNSRPLPPRPRGSRRCCRATSTSPRTRRCRTWTGCARRPTSRCWPRPSCAPCTLASIWATSWSAPTSPTRIR